MRMFDVQGIEIRASRSKVFEFLRDPRNLPRWAHAFKRADGGSARLETPAEQIEGALDAQRLTLQKELFTLKSLMET